MSSAQPPCAQAATARSSPWCRWTRTCDGGWPSTCVIRASANRSDGIRSQAAPSRHGVRLREAGRRREPALERGARRASALGVVGELVEERRLEVRGGPRRPDEHQASLGFVAGPVRQLPRDPDREPANRPAHAGTASSNRCHASEATARRSSGVSSVNRSPDPAVAARERHDHRHGADHDRASDARLAHDPNATPRRRRWVLTSSVRRGAPPQTASRCTSRRPTRGGPSAASASCRSPPGERRVVRLDGIEACALPLSGSCSVEVGGATFELEGRPDVFSRVSDFAYLPAGAEVARQRRGLRARPPERAGHESARHPRTSPRAPSPSRSAAVDPRRGRSTTSSPPTRSRPND